MSLETLKVALEMAEPSAESAAMITAAIRARPNAYSAAEAPDHPQGS